MRVEDLKNSVSHANESFVHEKILIDDLSEKIAITLGSYGSRRLNGYGYGVLASSLFVIPGVLACVMAYPLSEQNIFSRMTKKVLKTKVELEDGSVEVSISSSVGNPRKPGELFIEADNISRLQIQKVNFTHKSTITIEHYNPRFEGYWSLNNSEKWVEAREPSLEEIRINTQLIEVISQSMAVKVPQRALSAH